MCMKIGLLHQEHKFSVSEKRILMRIFIPETDNISRGCEKLLDKKFKKKILLLDIMVIYGMS